MFFTDFHELIYRHKCSYKSVNYAAYCDMTVHADCRVCHDFNTHTKCKGNTSLLKTHTHIVTQ